MSKPAITYCRLHAKCEVKPLHLSRGLLIKWAVERCVMQCLDSETSCHFRHKKEKENVMQPFFTVDVTGSTRGRADLV